MREEIIQQFWNAKIPIQKELKTTENQRLQIIDFGKLNNGQGPDFTGAHVLINGISHYGSIEIHVDSKNWLEHQHHLDVKYASVILHVVWTFSSEVRDIHQRILPTVALNRFFSLKDLQKSQIHLMNHGEFPCESFHQKILMSDKYQQLVFAQSKRWERKVDEVLLKHYEFRGNWHKVIFSLFAKYWMDHQNRVAMLQLTKDVDLIRLQKFSKDEMLAYWLGQSGMSIDQLFGLEDTHQIWTNFLFLKHKFQLQSYKLNWYFGRIRPNAFPNVRLWQWSFWMYQNIGSLSEWFSTYTYEELIQKLSISVQDTGNKIGGESEIINNGKQHIDQLIINVVIPLWMAYGTYHGNSKLIEHAMHVLEFVPAESNAITRKMKWLNIFNGSAKHSQQLMGQYQNFCQKKKCLDCLIGQSYANTKITE